MAPDGPFSLILNYRGYDIVLFSLPKDENNMDCDLKIFKDEVDVTKDIFPEPEPNSETLYEIMKKIDQMSKTT